MPRSPGCALIAAAAVALSCEPPPTEEQVAISVVDTPVEIDVDCDDAGACGGAEQVEVDVTFTEHDLIDDEAVIELMQYRVDYDVDELEGQEMPFFAENFGETGVEIAAGETVTVTVSVAGTTQRAWADSRLPNEEIDGTATITFAAYDHRNLLFEVASDPFEVRFDDYAPAEDTGTP